MGRIFLWLAVLFCVGFQGLILYARTLGDPWGIDGRQHAGRARARLMVLTMVEEGLTPPVLEVGAGQTIKLKIQNNVGRQIGVKIEGPGISRAADAIRPGEFSEMVLTPAEGRYRIFVTSGQVGASQPSTLVVKKERPPRP